MRTETQGTNTAYCLELFCVMDCKTAYSPLGGTRTAPDIGRLRDNARSP